MAKAVSAVSLPAAQSPLDHRPPVAFPRRAARIPRPIAPRSTATSSRSASAARSCSSSATPHAIEEVLHHQEPRLHKALRLEAHGNAPRQRPAQQRRRVLAAATAARPAGVSPRPHSAIRPGHDRPHPPDAGRVARRRPPRSGRRNDGADAQDRGQDAVRRRGNRRRGHHPGAIDQVDSAVQRAIHQLDPRSARLADAAQPEDAGRHPAAQRDHLQVHRATTARGSSATGTTCCRCSCRPATKPATAPA